jgi:hypothetical protein
MNVFPDGRIMTNATYQTSKKDENLLQIFGRRILRRTYGPINEGGVWRIRHNNEFYKLYSEPGTE